MIMSAPEFVPTPTRQLVRTYASPPWRGEPWFADRPGEIRGRQPIGEQLGSPGPDSGYALTLAQRFRGGLQLRDGEHEADALSGAAAVAMKRAALFGRAPVIHDVTVGLTIWGFLDAEPDTELVAVRREWFEEVHLSIHYTARQRIVDAATDEVLRMSHTTIADRHRADWRSILDLDAA